MKALKFIVSGVLLAWLAWGMDWSQVGKVFARLHLGLWLGAFALYAVIQCSSGLRWQLFARPLGFDQPTRQFIGFYYIGMFFNLVLPTSVGGDVLRVFYLDGKTGRRATALLTVLLDRISGLMVLLLVACLAAWFCPLDLPGWIPWSIWGTAAGAVLGLGGLAAFRRLPLLRVALALSRFRAGIDRCVQIFQEHPRVLLHTTLLSVVIQSVNVIMVWLIGLAIGAPVPWFFYWIVVPMITLLTVMPVSVNGMGVREGAMVLLMSQIGVTEAMALSIALLWFAVMAATSLCGGVVYMFGRFPRAEMRGEHEAVGNHSDQGRAGKPKAAA